MKIREPELSEKVEIDGVELPPHLGLDVSSRIEDVAIPIVHFGSPRAELIRPVIYEFFYRVRDGDGEWHTTSRRVLPGHVVQMWSYDLTKTYLFET